MASLTPTYYGLPALGIVNALGQSKQQVLENLLAGQSPGMVRRDGWLPTGSVMAGEVPQGLPEIPARLQLFESRNNQLLLAALEQIREQVDEAISRYGCDRIAVVMGSSTSGILEGEKALLEAAEQGGAPAGYHYRQQEIGTPGLFVAEFLELTGLAYTLSTACSSSAKVFASAQNLLALGVCDAVIVGGADSLCKLTINGFSALESVSSSRCNPFSENRDGITIGEGAAVFLMERETATVNLLGVGESADAHHISAPHPEGEGAVAAMRAALANAQLAPEQINYLNLHGTATPKNDSMESRAVNTVLGNKVPCSSTKPLIGHTLGAAGASEVALCWLLLSQSKESAILPAQIWDGHWDLSLAAIDLIQDNRSLPTIGPRRMMSNSFAFGGSNAAVIVGELETEIEAGVQA